MVNLNMGERFISLGKLLLNIFYRKPSLYIFLGYLILMSSYFSKVYSITGYIYLLVVPLFLVGLGLYLLYSRLLKRLPVKLIFHLVLGLLILVVYLINREFFNDFFHKIYIKDTGRLQQQIFFSIETDYLQFAPFVVPGVPLLTTLFLYIDRKGLGIVFVIFTAIIMVALSYIGFDEHLGSYLFIYFLLTSLYLTTNSFTRARLISLHRRFNTSLSSRTILNYSAVAALFIIGLTFVIPYFVSLKDIKKTALNLSSQMVTEDSFDLKSVGYSSNDSRLGGEIRPNNKIALKVKADRAYYLRGKVKDYYNGYLWLTTTASFYGEALSPDYYREHSELFKEKELRVYPQGLKIFSFFTPPRTFDINYRWARYIENGENIFKTVNDQAVSANYKVHFFDPTTDAHKFDITYKANTYSTSSPLRYEPELESYKHHLQLPTSITERTYRLIYRIIRESKSEEEKLERIKNYLLTNYKYSLNTSDLPEERDFVDYFLFEEKRGYCTYFATTAAIFCRIAGIPTRYVEGFRMHDNRDENGFYVISNSMAHAWTEVLVDPASNHWIVFDCTPSDYLNIVRTPIRTAYPEYLDRYMNREGLESEFQGGANLELEAKREFSLIEAIRSEKTAGLLIRALQIAGLLLVLLATAYLIYQALFFSGVRRKLLKGPGVIKLYDYSKVRLRALGILFTDYLTDEENSALIKDRHLQTMMNRLIGAYHDEYFGEKPALDYNKRHFLNYLEGKIRRELGFIGYIRSFLKEQKNLL